MDETLGTLEILATGKGIVVPVGSRSIVKEGKRYKVYLPATMNRVWEELRRKGKDIDIIIVLK